MTPDQAVTQIREGLKAGEAMLKAIGDKRNLRRVKRAHAVLEDVALQYVGPGVVSGRSDGGGKEGG